MIANIVFFSRVIFLRGQVGVVVAGTMHFEQFRQIDVSQ